MHRNSCLAFKEEKIGAQSQPEQMHFSVAVFFNVQNNIEQQRPRT